MKLLCLHGGVGVSLADHIMRQYDIMELRASSDSSLDELTDTLRI